MTIECVAGKTNELQKIRPAASRKCSTFFPTIKGDISFIFNGTIHAQTIKNLTGHTKLQDMHAHNMQTNNRFKLHNTRGKHERTHDRYGRPKSKFAECTNAHTHTHIVITATAPISHTALSIHVKHSWRVENTKEALSTRVMDECRARCV